MPSFPSLPTKPTARLHAYLPAQLPNCLPAHPPTDLELTAARLVMGTVCFTLRSAEAAATGAPCSKKRQQSRQ